MEKEKIVGCCGQECFRCITYLATVQDDDALRRQSQQFYRELFGWEIPLAECKCLGCQSEQMFRCCGGCPFLSCAAERGISHCRDCGDYPCETLAAYQEKYVNKCHQVPPEPASGDIEHHIAENLSGDALQTALAFVRFLKQYDVTFYRDTCDCWKEKLYYWVKYGEDCVCFLAIRDPDEPEHSWTVWSEDSAVYETPCADAEIRETAWKHIDFCGNCGSCGGGRDKTVFGKTFARVCGCTFRIDDGGMRDLPFLKTMAELRIKELSDPICP